MKVFCVILFLAGSAWAQSEFPDRLPPIVDPPPPPLNGKLTVTFTGQSTFTPDQLREGISRQIESIESYGLDQAGAYDAEYFLEVFYRQRGYAKVDVRSKIEGPWALALEIDEGPSVLLGQVSIEGDEQVDAKTITDLFLGPIREQNPRIRDDLKLPFSRGKIFAGANLVRRYYAAEGYLDAVVEAPEIQVNANDTADVSLQIVEGMRYRFGETRFLGEAVFSDETLAAVVEKPTEDIFTEGRVAAGQRALVDYFRKHGYFQVSVTGEGDLTRAKDGEVPVDFTIVPGKVFRFGGITVAGQPGVQPSFVKKRLADLQGETYDPRSIDQAFRELVQTGLFKTIRIVPEAVSDDEVNLTVRLEEARTREVGFGVGYASFFGGVVSASYRNLNLFGTGRSFGANLEVNQRGLNGEITYVDPWWFDSDYELRLRLYGVNSILRGYTKNEFGFQPSLSRDLTKHWKVSAFVRAKVVDVVDIDIQPASLVGPTSYSVASVGISQTIDFRNSITQPTKGFVLTTSLEFAPDGVSEISFLRAVGAFSYYLPVTKRSTLSFGARVGIMSPLSDTVLPIDERFFNGGATTVRSFSEYTLGPRDRAGYPLGGETFTVFNIEYDFPLVGDLFGAVFVDAGNVISEASDFGLQNMGYAVGVGLRYRLPIGSIRLDYGLNPDPRDGEATGAWQFAVGVAF